MNRGSRGRAQAAVPKAHKIHATSIAFLGSGKNLLRLHVEEAETHGPIPHDPFQVSSSPATAVRFLGIEGYNHVATLPHTFAVRIASESDAVANGPNAYQPVRAALGNG